MASGRWVKVRVEANGVYGFTHARLTELGFRNPEAVKVYGYAPTKLLTHNHNLIPGDLVQMQSIHADKQLLFYATGAVDYSRELWEKESSPSALIHLNHSHSRGATYFLSDTEGEHAVPARTAAPDNLSNIGAESIVTSHESLIYEEEDVISLSEGGAHLLANSINASSPASTLDFTVSKAAQSRKARMVYAGALSPSMYKSTNFLLASYPSEIEAEDSKGIAADKSNLSNHQLYTSFIRYQQLKLPEKASEGDYSFRVSLALHPNCAELLGNGGLDFAALLYERDNDLEGARSAVMYFYNTQGPIVPAFTGMSEGNWHVWNVTKPESVNELAVTASAGVEAMVSLPASAIETPNILAVFRSDAAQTEPELIGEVANQNLHAMPTPDMVILTSAPLLEAAEEAAEFHRSRQGLEVEVVDQQLVFNEYGSGNVSPEAIRRFMAHLYKKNPTKLSALLIIGPGTIYNAQKINPESEWVITSQAEDITSCQYDTRNSCADIFFGHLGLPATSYAWANRCDYFKVIGSGMHITVGRLPFRSPLEVAAYYAKAAEYHDLPHSAPMAGNMVVASDYAPATVQSHMRNGENLISRIRPEILKNLTATRAASDIISINDNNINRKILFSSLERGASFLAYFGHGSFNQIGGSTKRCDYLLHTSSADNQQAPERYPVAFVGSCSTAAFDYSPDNLVNSMLLNSQGGVIAALGAGRSVYQSDNETLGCQFASRYFELSSDQWIGEAWRGSVNAIISNSVALQSLCNILDYNLLGDPCLPSFNPTDVVEATLPSSELVIGRRNTVSGRIITPQGEDAADFNGHVLLTLYDVPVKKKNLARTGTNIDPTHVDSLLIDQEIIGEYVGKVTHGQFSVEIKAPDSPRNGVHRMQLYAYSDDDTRRALGTLADLTLTPADSPEEGEPEPAPVITAFMAGDGEPDGYYRGNLTLNAEIEVPAGLVAPNPAQSALRLTIDKSTRTNARRMLRPSEPGHYTLRYPLTDLSAGRHTATLEVFDANGNFAESSIEFFIDNAQPANLSAAVGEGDVNFELSVTGIDATPTQLIIENLSGESVVVRSEPVFPCTVSELEPGAYRAFVQLSGESAVTASSKIEFIID